MKKNRMNQKGLTLIEVLLVMVISSIIAGVAYSIFFTSISSSNKTMSDTQLRNEAILITQQFDKAMQNIEAISSATVGIPATKIDATNKMSSIDAAGTLLVTELKTVFEINNNILEMKNYENGILKSSQTLNSSQFSLKGTTFEVIETENNAKKKKALKVHFKLTETKTEQQYEVVKIYGLQSE